MSSASASIPDELQRDKELINSPSEESTRMSIKKLLLLVLIIGGIGVTLWVGLDAVMRGVTEMEKNMGGARQVVKDDRTKTLDD